MHNVVWGCAEVLPICFSKVTMSPFRYQLVMENQLLYQAAPVIDRLSSQEESSHYIYCAAR